VERERLAAVGEMMRRLAHNLRNPLSGIRGLAEVTRDEVRDSPDLRDHQERIIASVDRFERWLSDLLSVTKPLAVLPEPARVEPLLTGLVDAHRPMARQKDIVLELDMASAPAEACFDPRHLEHSLVAILTNAIQASPAKTTVRVTARSVDAGAWEVRIADQGPGVPPEIVDKVFNAYFTTKKDGNGIGLAVAQQVVRAHGGRITIERGLNGSVETRGIGPGATFVVRIPVRPPSVPDPDSSPTVPTN
jgi:signal transduction histidine kinase